MTSSTSSLFRHRADSGGFATGHSLSAPRGGRPALFPRLPTVLVRPLEIGSPTPGSELATADRHRQLADFVGPTGPGREIMPGVSGDDVLRVSTEGLASAAGEAEATLAASVVSGVLPPPATTRSEERRVGRGGE